MHDGLIQRYYDLDFREEAERLHLLGSRGFPGVDNLVVLADMLSMQLQLHSLTFDQMPTENFGIDLWTELST